MWMTRGGTTVLLLARMSGWVKGMSISRHLDRYMDEEGIIPTAEVEPDHPCQVFENVEGVRVIEVTPQTRLNEARKAVQDVLGVPVLGVQ